VQKPLARLTVESLIAGAPLSSAVITALAGKQDLDGTLTALAGLNWTAGNVVVVMTAADTFALKTIGVAAGDILDRAAGDALYQPIGSYLTAVNWGSIGGSLSAQADLVAALAAKAPDSLSLHITAGAAYTLAAADVWGHRRFTNAGAVTLTIDTTHGFAVGERARFTQAGAGQVTMTATGVTLNSRGGALKSAGQYAVWELELVAANEFDVLGDVTS
jgi:hypothetical protein